MADYIIDFTLNGRDALAWREQRGNKRTIVVNVIWLNEEFNKLVKDIDRAIVHEILHDIMQTENEKLVEKAERLLYCDVERVSGG